MNQQSTPKVIFVRIKTNVDKLQWICHIAEESFATKSNLLILVNSLEAAHYVDALLWKYPPSSFLPHVISDLPTTSPLAISIQNRENINRAESVINLSPQLAPLFANSPSIYEFFDESSEIKATLSEQKIQEYREKALSVNIIA